MKYTADLETITEKQSIEDGETRIWAWGLCEIDNPDNSYFGINFEEMFEFLLNNGDDHNTLYYHNLKFDGEFNVIWLLSHGFKHVESRKFLEEKTFTTLISDKNQWYEMDICFYKQGNRSKKIKIYNSLTIFPQSVKKIAKAFGFKEQKGDIDYHLHREVGYIPTRDEILYIKNDVTIMARTMKELFKMGHTKMTLGGNALSEYKYMITKKRFDKLFPPPIYDLDYILRQSYRGGFTYLMPQYANKIIRNVKVYDVNSLYPAVLKNCKLPYGEPIFYRGQYKKDRLYNAYIQIIECEFELKKNYIPTIQIKHTLKFSPTEYLESSNGETVVLCLTNVDLDLFLEHYNVYNLEYLHGWKYKARKGNFDEYIDYWSDVKIKSKKSGNMGMYMYAKLMLNNLYGKFAKNPRRRKKIPYLEDGKAKYQYTEYEISDSLYIPVGTFVTAYARDITIRSAQLNYNRFVYADTDSIHLLGLEDAQGIEIDSYKLGAWKHEYDAWKCKYLRSKAYFDCVRNYDYDSAKIKGEIQKELCYNKRIKRVKIIYPIYHKVVCAGMTDNIHSKVTLENFNVGMEYEGKLNMKHVSGGIVLTDTTYKIKEKLRF